MVGFAQDMAETDALAFAMLGEDALYRVAGSTAWIPVSVFLEDRGPTPNYEGMDGVAVKLRIKVSKAQVPNPSDTDRWQVPLLGAGNLRQVNREDATANRDWLIELQRAKF